MNCQIKIYLLLICQFPICLFAQTWVDYFKMADEFYQTQEFDSAINYANEARVSYQRDDTILINIWYFLGECHFQKKSYLAAIDAWQQCASLEKIILRDKSLRYIQILKDIGKAAIYANDLSLAERSFLDAYKIEDSVLGPHDLTVFKTMNDLATVKFHLGKHQDAINLLEEILSSSQIEKESPFIAAVLINLAGIKKYQGQFSDAEKFYKQALSCWKKTGIGPNARYAKLLDGYAELQFLQGRNQVTENLLTQSKNIRYGVLGENHLDYGLSMHNLACLFLYQEKLEEARKLFLQCLPIWNNNPYTGKIFHANTLHRLAETNRKSGLLREADSLLNISLRIQEELKRTHHISYALTLYQQGILYWELEKLQEAREALFQSKTIFEQLHISNRLEAAEVLLKLGMTSCNVAFEEESIQHIKSGIDLLCDQVRFHFPLLNERQKNVFMENKASSIFEDFFVFALDYPQIFASEAFNIYLTTQALAMEGARSLRKTILANGDSMLLEKYETWLNLRSQISYLYESNICKPKGKSKNQSISKLMRAADSLESWLISHSQEFEDQIQGLDLRWEDIQTNLKSDEAVVAFFNIPKSYGGNRTGGRQYVAFVIRPDYKSPRMLKIGSEEQITNKLLSLLDNARSREGVLTNDRQELYHILWKPIDSLLSGVDKIYFCSSGLLHLCPFDVLTDEKGEFLIDRFDIRYKTTLRDLALKSVSQHSGPNTIAILGLSNFRPDSDKRNQDETKKTKRQNYGQKDIDNRDEGLTQEIPTLPRTIDEAKYIRKKAKRNGWIVQRRIDQTKNESWIKSLSGIHAPKVIHLATHGFYNGGTESESTSNSTSLFNSALIVNRELNRDDSLILKEGDGVLTAYEVLNLDLRKTEVVVLSACETGLGEIMDYEGVNGLQRAFRIAGVETVIMSLWEVDDRGTVILMKEFYREYLKGVEIHEAFAHARKRLKKREDPSVWAAFILIE